MNWALYSIAALSAIGTFTTITSVGQHRKPLTPGTAAVVTLLVVAAVKW